MMSKSVISLSSLVAVALMTASTIGCSKPTHKGQKTFDKDLIGYWAPSPKEGTSPEQDSGAGGSDMPPVIQIDSKGDVLGFDEAERKFFKIGVLQANGSVLLTPEASNSESGPVSFVLSKIDVDNIKAVGTGPESSESGSGESVGGQKIVKKEFYFKRFTQSQQDEFNKALAAGIQTNNPTSPGTVSGPSDAAGSSVQTEGPVSGAEEDPAAADVVEEEKESQLAGNEGLEPSPRIPTNEWVEIDPRTWEAHFAIPNPVLLQ